MSTRREVVIVKQGGKLFPLFLVFLVLKLCGVINWSWWFVSMPLWICPAIAIGVFLTVAIIGLFIMMIAGICACFLNN